jgi:ribosomal protein L29
MKIKELREKNEKELKVILAENRGKLRQLRFELAARQTKNAKDIGKTRKEIARILTLLNVKTLN